ncbi:bifunctional 3-(3-hydroxy-phenyl)propionate/3-hydroxycinnamic acid hydroxylase [Streptomyces sp. NPDC047081]|uniref:bifunctional 3-(3-hydroxy-phenyl)propionate/3-hydroxycinnamic acid hydroxylase n=1 Tax=Streptomyces sp. NPDC047081 TaxID=3154706 RepID=UPI0034044872
MAMDACTVAVVGYGPVGGALANLLARQGIDVLVIEEHPDIYPLPRAGGLVPESMRLMQIVGVADELAADMKEVTLWYDIFDKDWNLVVKREPDIGDTRQVWPNHYTFLQPLLETAVRRENGVQGVRTRTGCRVTGLDQDATGVSLTVADVKTGGKDTVRADWVVGCDGSRSFVRSAIGSEQEDLGGDEAWLLVHLRLTDDSVKLPERLFQWAHPERAVTFVPNLPAGLCLFEFRVMPGDTVEELTSEAKVWELLRPWLHEGQADLVRVVVYEFHTRVANGWRDGRVMIAGDAAHVMPPDLGEGLNSGFRDAINLGWKLGGVVNGQWSESLLDTYETERRPHVYAFTVLSNALAVATSKIADDPDTYRATLALDSVFRHPHPRVGPGVHGEAPYPAGHLAEQPVLADGRRLDDVIGYRFALVGDPELIEQAVAADHDLWSSLDPAIVSGEDPQVAEWLSRLDARVVVVRPDRLLFGTAANSEDLAALATQLRTLHSNVTQTAGAH